MKKAQPDRTIDHIAIALLITLGVVWGLCFSYDQRLRRISEQEAIQEHQHLINQSLDQLQDELDSLELLW
ncbi:MAG: hypothetical protein JJV96_02645 [Alphaproteobacteria bacterium]|nr:hypothetical protein [Alphaproteobacteria bacterium]